MSNYRFDNRSGGGRSFGGGGDRRRAEMHDAICDECGKDCKVPFRPSGDKPIYCSDCFEKQGGRAPRGSSRSSSGGAGASAQSIEKLNQSIEALNKKLNTIIELLSKGDVKKPEPVEIKKEKKK
ncbi:MAG: CxxC-x17-CxxC domain-containing protein [Candidatus Beckwithbacteria bacterium]|nr:hypothetical protein [Patescibacteria group bacterium]